MSPEFCLIEKNYLGLELGLGFPHIVISCGELDATSVLENPLIW